MQELIFGDMEVIQSVYKGKQNLIKKPKKKKEVKQIDFNDYRDFMLKKGWIKVIEGRTEYNLETLQEPFKKNGKIVNDGHGNPLMKHINDKEILKYYKDNLKLKSKFNKVQKDLALQNKIYREKNSNFIKAKISKLEKDLFTLKSKIIF